MANRNGLSVKVDMKGLDTIDKIREIGPKLARKGLRKALNAVGNYWIPEVQSRVPVLSGDLRSSIIKAIKTKRDKKNDEISGTVWVGPAANAERTDNKDSVGPGVYGIWVLGFKFLSPLSQ